MEWSQYLAQITHLAAYGQEFPGVVKNCTGVEGSVPIVASYPPLKIGMLLVLSVRLLEINGDPDGRRE